MEKGGGVGGLEAVIEAKLVLAEVVSINPRVNIGKAAAPTAAVETLHR